MGDYVTVPITRMRCPTCDGSGRSSEHFASPHQIQDEHGKWIVSPYCAMCFGHGTVIVRPSPR